MKTTFLNVARCLRAKNLKRFKSLVVFYLISTTFLVQAQSPGDTIVVKAFKYGSSTRDTVIQFPNGNLSYEKIIMKYNMRCKNNLVSNSAQPNQGCGEWDYSCNTFVVDSTRIENELNNAPKYIISNFNGNTFQYTSLPLYDYFNYTQTQVNLNNIISETQYSIGIGSTANPYLLETNKQAGRSQILYTAAELTNAGFGAGNIDGILLDVANGGGTANFLKIGMRHTAQNSLSASATVLSGFTNVFHENYTFTTGSNRLQFHTPFVWDGISNVLIEYSFTNTVPDNAVVFQASATGSIQALYAANHYALDLSAMGHVNLNTTLLSAINNEVTFSFWAYGTASLMPTRTSILYGYATNPDQRGLNIHLPWDNNNIYFDCGFANGGYDRIEKTATPAEQGGQWRHWTFTKNATAGTMNIYMNGNLWMSGTSKTRAMSFLTIILGKDQNLQSNFKGKIKELTIWDKSLSIGDIQAWMNKPINPAHPFYANLLAYYKMDEGTGQIITDSKHTLTSSGTNLQWLYERGHKLEQLFSETNLRPNIVFLQGTYALSTNTITVKDSVARNPNIIQQYSITSNASFTPMTHDEVVLESTTNLYHTAPLNIYDGDSGLLTGTLAVTPQGALTMSSLPYYRRFPYYNEIMSFVTPYGLGLNLGARGKTWYYDVSDFAPLLKGKKRFMMTMGGEYQEQMDIDFWFIVGTPPRNVIEFNQLWQGGARLGGVGISSILNDTRFTSQSVSIPANAQTFKVRSTITGHGQHGEFAQNGGLVTHYFNINGGANEFSWPITMECSFNPVFPQGGTWVYDRQGWCPGAASLTKEHDITPFVTAGTTATLDYNCSPPALPNGDYRYIVAHQLVSYGSANHTLDAALEDVLAPSAKVLYSRSNPICSNPLILVRNTGSTTITELEFDYWLNNNQKETGFWIGNLGFMDTVYISLPVASLWSQEYTPANNVFHVEIKSVNSVQDNYVHNNTYHAPFTLPDILPNDITVEFRTNNNPYENMYRIVDEAGFDIPGASALMTANTTYTDSYSLNGCYKLIVEDLGGDGLQWWANTAQGSGFVRIRNTSTGAIIKSFQTDFGGGIEYSFSTIPHQFVGLKKLNDLADIRIYPNPAQTKFQVSGDYLDGARVALTDLLGRSLEIPVSKDETGLTFDTSSLKPGVYLVSITKNNENHVRKMVIH